MGKRRGREKSEWNDLLLLFFRGFPAKPIPLFLFYFWDLAYKTVEGPISFFSRSHFDAEKISRIFLKSSGEISNYKMGSRHIKFPWRARAHCAVRTRHNTTTPSPQPSPPKTGPEMQKQDACVKRGGRRKDLINPPSSPFPLPPEP